MADITSATYYNDWKTVLIPRLRETEAWSDLFDAISEVFANNIYKYIELLRYIRDPGKQDKQVNIQQAEFLGFKYNSDKFTDEEYANIVYFLNYYNRKVKGTQDFINFLGWVKNAKFKLIQLWATGEYNYSDDPEVKDPFVQEGWITQRNSMVDDTGSKLYYPTSHVDLTYNGEDYEIDESDVWYLFYKCAPIHLVLRSIAAVISSDPYYLNFNFGINNHTNTHWCIPCIYYNPAKLYFGTGSGISSITHKLSSYQQYGLKRGTYVTYYDLYSFDTNFNSETLSPQFTFTRDSSASNIKSGWIRYMQVGNNEPRFKYTYNKSNGTWTGNGLLIEKASSNFLLDSFNPSTRQVVIDSGIYTFSGSGKYRVVNVSESRTIGTVSNSSLTFSVTTETVIRITVLETPEYPWYQLERGNRATSPILSTSLTLGDRSTDILSCFNLPTTEKSGTFILEFSDIAEECILLKVYESSTQYLEIKRRGQKVIATTRNGFSTPALELDYTGRIVVSIRPGATIINGEVATFPVENNVNPKYCYIGQDEGRESISGYITKFYYVPCFIEQELV